MRHWILLGLVLVISCGRSGLGARGDARPDERPSDPADAADQGSRGTDVQGEGDVTTESPCPYRVSDDFVVSCQGQYQLVMVMSSGQNDCPTYNVYKETGQRFDDALRAEKDCLPSCIWRPSTYSMGTCSPPGVFRDYVLEYYEYAPECPQARTSIWYSSITDRIYTSYDQANATLPVCADGGAPG